MSLKLHAIVQKRGKRYIAWIEELPGVNTQGSSVRVARKNLQEALNLFLSVRRELAEKQLQDAQGEVLRMPLAA